MPKFTRNLATVEEHFDREMLARILTMPEHAFGRYFDLDGFIVDQPDNNYYFFKDNGSSVLAVAHLDTVVAHRDRDAEFDYTDFGEILRSGALDDRLGAYTILDLLPKCGIEYDILLTIGEESGESTAAYFETDKDYDWIIEFDRGGTDVVMYQYETTETIDAVRRTGARVGDGIFSDISYMSHVGAKAWNWGVGYRDYHSIRGHVYIDDYLEMIARYLKFHQQNAGRAFPHTADEDNTDWWGSYRSGPSKYGRSGWWNDDMTTDETDDDLDTYQRAGLTDMADHRTGYHGLGYDDGESADGDPWAGENVYAEHEYIEDPSNEEILAAIEKMEEDEARWREEQLDKLREADPYTPEEADRLSEIDRGEATG